MPVIVPCPTCSTHVSVKDDHVGRKLRCPKCKTDLDPPAVEVEEPPAPPPPPPAPTPVLARPAPPPARLLPPPPPPPPPRQPTAESFEYEYEMPRQLPGRKRPRRRASDAGEPNSDAQTMIYVGGLAALLVVIGVSIVAYSYLIKPLMNSGSAAASGLAARNNSNVTQANAQRIQSGMTLAQVEAILGKGRPAAEQDFLDAQNQMNDRAFTESMFPWVAKLRAGEVLAWTNGKSRLMVGFTRPPGEGGTVVGVVAVIADGLSAWSVHFLDTRPGGGYIGNAAPGGHSPPGAAGEERPIDVAAADLTRQFAADPGAAEARYKGKLVRVVGEVKFARGQRLVGGEYGGSTYEVFLSYRPEQADRARALQVGDGVTVIGRVGRLDKWSDTRRVVYVNDCRIAD